MRKIRIFLLSFLTFLIIPSSVKAYSCVLTGAGDYCTRYGTRTTTSRIQCNSGSPISCNSFASPITNSSTISWYCKGVTGNNDYGYRYCLSQVRLYSPKYTITLTENKCGTTTVNATGGNYSIRYWKNWTTMNGLFGPYNSPKKTKNSIGADECVAYDGQTVKTVGGKKLYYYSQFLSRCCSGASPAPADSPPACYRKKLSDTSYDYKWTVTNPGGYTKIDAIKSEKECVIKNPNSCEASNISSPVNKEINTCSGKMSFDLQDGNQCVTASTSPFYKITCKDTASVDFENNSSNNIIKLKAGGGFNYNVNLVLKKICTGEFYNNLWTESYNNAVSSIRRAEVVKDATEKKYFEKIRDDILKAIDSYNTWKDTANHEYGGTISFNYKAKGKDKKFTGEFISTSSVELNDNIVTSNCFTLNGKKVCNYTNQLVSTTTVLLQPPNAYIDRNTGEVLLTPNDNTIDGGHKFYTDQKTDAGTYAPDVEIAIDKGQSATIHNKICSLTIEKTIDELNYRIIDNSDPFINKDREKGQNWTNDIMSFVNIIDDSVWTKSPLYVFNLSQSKIRDIKESNRRNSEAYLGTCHLNRNIRDEVMQDICDIINSK